MRIPYYWGMAVLEEILPGNRIFDVKSTQGEVLVRLLPYTPDDYRPWIRVPRCRPDVSFDERGHPVIPVPGLVALSSRSPGGLASLPLLSQNGPEPLWAPGRRGSDRGVR